MLHVEINYEIEMNYKKTFLIGLFESYTQKKSSLKLEELYTTIL